MFSISDSIFSLRNRVLSDARFQRWAATFPLTRFVAQRRASALFDLCAGFVYSQVLFAVVRLELLEALAREPSTPEELASLLALPVHATRRLLDAATSLELLERRSHGRYGVGIHGASLLGNPSVAQMVEHHALLYSDLSDPVALLRGENHDTALHRFWTYATNSVDDRATARSEESRSGDAATAAYSNLMASSQALIAEDIIEAYPHARHQSLLDVGGGDGTFLEAASAHAPHLDITLFDLPSVASRALDRFQRAGLSPRAKVVAGNIFHDPLPTGADLVSLIRVIHDHDDAQALHILRAARAALESSNDRQRGGVLLLAEPMSDTPNAERMGDAYFGFYLLAMGQGRPRSAEALTELMLKAGFASVKPQKTRRPMLARLLIGQCR